LKIRCRAHLTGPVPDRVWHLTSVREETFDHLALKLAACLMFQSEDPVPEPSPKHPALQDQDFRPNLMALDAAGYMRLWVDCGTVSLHKLEKVARRFQNARIIVIKKSPREAEKFREQVREETKQAAGRTEVWAFPEGLFAEWRSRLGEDTHVVGEAHEKSLNVVVNDQPYVVDLVEIP
jgi:hypothetical protein